MAIHEYGNAQRERTNLNKFYLLYYGKVIIYPAIFCSKQWLAWICKRIVKNQESVES